MRAIVRVYRSVGELPELLEPGKYIVEGVEITVHEPTGGLAYSLRKDRETSREVERYGGKGWA